MNKYVEIIIIAFLALASTSSAGNNTITHHIIQTVDGELVPEGSNWFQNAGLGSMVMGEDNLLSQFIEQHLDSNSDIFIQESNLTGIVTGDNNTIYQASKQVASGNDIFDPSGKGPIQKINEVALLIGNGSRVNQSINQTAINNSITRSMLSQLATESTIIIGDSQNVTQEINQTFNNRTLKDNGRINQSASQSSIIIAPANQTGQPGNGTTPESDGDDTNNETSEYSESYATSTGVEKYISTGTGRSGTT